MSLNLKVSPMGFFFVSLFWSVCLISDFFLSRMRVSMYFKLMETGQNSISYTLRALPIDFLNDIHNQYIMMRVLDASGSWKTVYR